MKFPVFILILCAVVIPLTAGGVDETSSAANIIITDYFDREIRLNGPAMSIVSLSPGITETVFALGYGDRLIGRTSFCDYPPEAMSIPEVGSLTEPNVEIIAALDPDIVIASTHFPEEALKKLENAGLNIAVLMGQESFQGAYDGVIRPVSTLLGDSEAGEQLVSDMEATFLRAREIAMKRTAKPKIYYVVGFGDGGDWTAGGDTFISEMIHMAGGENIAADVKGWSYSLEALVDKDPDIILVPSWALDIFPSTPIYNELRAVRNGHVFAVDENAIVRQGPRLAEGYENLVNIIGSID
ncbi:MAG: ABC transporter substrate-binding protein [Spirochaetaceae bacterium]|nr:ABC transporter substrate-binding protein [Spirochaetaceae bacterium]